MTLTLLREVGEERPDAVDHAPQIHAEHPFEVPFGQIGDCQPATPDAGVVAHDVYGTESLDRRCGEGRNVRLDRRVGEHGEHVNTGCGQFGRNVLE